MKMKSNTTKKFFREKDRKEGKKRKRKRRAKNKETQGVSVLPLPCALLSFRPSRLPPCRVLGVGGQEAGGRGQGPPDLKGLWFWRPGWDPKWEDGVGSGLQGLPTRGGWDSSHPLPGGPLLARRCE